MKKFIKATLSLWFSAAMLVSTVNAAPTVSADELQILPFFKYYDYKTFNGSTCQPRFGNQSADLDTGTFGIYNKTGASRWISCPIMRDDTEKVHGASVTVYLNNAKNTWCYVYSLDPHGVNVKSQSKKVQADGKQKLSFSLNKSAKMGNYFMYCSLTSKGYVNSYKLSESYTDLNRRTDKDATWPPIFPWPPVIDPVLTK